MTTALAHARIRRLVAHDKTPELSAQDLDSLYAIYGEDETNAGMNAAVLEGWEIKTAAASEMCNLTTGGDIGSLSRRQIYENCEKQRNYWKGVVNGGNGLTTVQPSRGTRCC